MRKAWTYTFAVALLGAGITASLAVADPSSWALRRQSATEQSSSSLWPWSKTTSASTQKPPFVGHVSEPVSPLRHPVQYFKNATSSKGKVASVQHPTMPPAGSKSDPLSLSTPTGPPTPEFFIFAGQMCERQGDIAQARANFQRALSMWPGHVEVLRAAARMEDRQGNLPLAENLYGQAVHSNPQHAGALNDLGLCLARQGKLEPSVQVLEQAIQLQPTKALYRNNAATVLVEMHQEQRALAHLAAVHGPAEANYNLGQILVDRGRPNDAVVYFQAALQQDPAMQPAQEALAKLQGNRMAAAKPRTISVPVSPVPTAPPVAVLPTATAPPVVTTPVAAAPAAAVPTSTAAAATTSPVPATSQVAAQPAAPPQAAATAAPQATVPTPVAVAAATPAAAPVAVQNAATAPVPVATQLPEQIAQTPAVAPAPVAVQPQVATQVPTPAATAAPTPQYVPPVASLPTTGIVR